MKNELPDLKIEVAGSHQCVLGEGPVWDEENNVICWVDIIRGEIHQLAVDSNVQRTLRVHQMVGSVALCNNGKFVGGLEHGIHFIDRDTGVTKEIVHPEKHLSGNRFNDGKCDPSGRFWVGSMSLAEEPEAGTLYLLDNKFSITEKVVHTTVSNGMAWSADKKFFYFVDSPTLGVDCFDYDDLTGNISNRRKIIRFDGSDGVPDGMTIDKDGMLWIAQWDGWRVSRWNPGTGEKLLSVKLPAARVTSCTFGGDDLGDLYITTARTGLSQEEILKQPLAGNLFVIRNTGYRGSVASRFRF